jgi:type I restriction enzyme R subunit
LDVFDEVKIAEQIELLPDKNNLSPEHQRNKAIDILAQDAKKPICSPLLREFILNARKAHDQIIDPTIDSVIYTGWGEERAQKAEGMIRDFRKFIEDNKNEISALSIIYSQSYKNRPLTIDMINLLYEAMQKSEYHFSTENLWQSYVIKFPDKVKSKSPVNKLTDIVSLIRFELGYTKELNLFSTEVNLRFQKWTFKKQEGTFKFTEEQIHWLRMIRDHIAVSLSITKDDLDLDPFGEQGGLGKFYQLFGNRYEEILEEINGALAA